MLGLDAYPMHQRPVSMYTRNTYDVTSALARNRAGFNMLFDRELGRVRTQRENLSSFVSDQ